MLSYSIPFSPSSWHQLCDSTKKMWLSCQEMLEIVARKPLLPYSELNNFVGPVEPDLTIRPSILEFVKNRPRASFSSVQECAAIDKLISSPTIRTNSQKVIDQAEQVFTLLMGISEPARKFDLSIIYHPWLRIPPVKLDDPLTFYTTSNEDPWLFNALQAFLVIVTAHPYSDGNGRVSRIVFNSYVRRNCENGFLPIADILRASAGYYEEHLARAAVTGRYDDTVLYLLRLFNCYFNFIVNEASRRTKKDKLEEIFDNISFLNDRDSIFYSILPHVISYKDLRESKFLPVDSVFLKSIRDILAELSLYANIKYIVCPLRKIVAAEILEPVPILVVLSSNRVDDLLIKSRAVKSRQAKLITLRIALESDDSVANAKLLLSFCLSNFGPDKSDVMLISDIFP